MNNNEVLSLENFHDIVVRDSSTLEEKERLSLTDSDIYSELVKLGDNQIAAGNFFSGEIKIVESN